MKPPLATALACALLVAACVPPPAPIDEGADAKPEAEPAEPEPEPEPEPKKPRELVRRYGVESGVIRYTVTGPQVGTEELYFVDYGDREARYAALRDEGDPDGPPSVERVTILDGTTQHTIDLKTQLGTTVHDVYRMFGGLEAVRRRLAGKTLAEGMLEILGGKQTGAETIAEVECELWELQQGTTRICEVGGVPLSTTMVFGERERVTRAIEVKFGAEVPEAKLAIPKGAVLHRFGESMASQAP